MFFIPRSNNWRWWIDIYLDIKLYVTWWNGCGLMDVGLDKLHHIKLKWVSALYLDLITGVGWVIPPSPPRVKEWFDSFQYSCADEYSNSFTPSSNKNESSSQGVIRFLSMLSYIVNLLSFSQKLHQEMLDRRYREALSYRPDQRIGAL